MGTFTESRKNHVHNQEIELIGTFTFGSSYTNGGETLNTGLSVVRHANFHPKEVGVIVEYDIANQKVKAMTPKIMNMALGKPLLAIGTSSAAAIKITNAFHLLVGGSPTTVAAAEKAFTATTHDIPANASLVQEAVYLLSADNAGAVTLTMGTIADGAGNATIPSTPANQVAFGYLRLAVAAGATDFDATTDLLSAGHLTDTYVDLSHGPKDIPMGLEEIGAGADLGSILGAVECVFKGK